MAIEPYENDLALHPTCVLVIEVAKKRFYATLKNNPSAKMFVEKLSPQAFALNLQDCGGFKKVGKLPWKLTGSDEQITANPGDIALYQGSQITIYYDQNKEELTRIAVIDYTTKEELLNAFGESDIWVKMYLEWSE